MSEETVLRFKLATLASISIGILVIAVSVICIWVGYVSSQTNQNTTDIATLKECAKNQKELLVSIDIGIKALNQDFNSHARKEALKR